MSKGISCKCAEKQKPVEQRNWVILQYKSNRSAFNGYHSTASDYSALQCKECTATWRTKAAYVDRVRRTKFAFKDPGVTEHIKLI